MAWGNILKRRMKVFTMALVIYVDYKALKQREKWISKTRISDLWEKAHERNAKRVLRLMIELEGLWVKLGQYLSSRADVLPAAYIYLLKQLQDSLPPRPLQEVCQTIEKELGKSMEDLFSNFVETPLATASIAQVHRATLLDGKEVVVKVQHEDVKAIILEDLKNAKAIIDWIAWAEPQYDFNPMIDEWCKEAPKELDFNREAENTRTVSRNLSCRNQLKEGRNTNQVDVLIPEVIESTEKVLILEYMDGIRLNDSASLEAYGVDKQRIIEEITCAYAHQIYVDGFFNGDPHPGNFLVSKEPPHRPILLDFGLTKKLSNPFKLALAKMFLASAEGDHAALLSAFIEMGLKFRLDMPEQAMTVANVFFRATTPANESAEAVKSLLDQRAKNMKVIQEKLKLNEKEVKRFNPVDAVPGDIIMFTRVLHLLRGLSALMNVRIRYLDIMRPFADAVLRGSMNKEPNIKDRWICDTPIHSDVEAKLRQLLVTLGNEDKILGIQVCAYKDGKVIIDTAAGFLGRYDPRPVQPDSLFSIFSCTKGITAGMVHWLVDKGKLKLEENVADVWPEFGSNGKNHIKVHHVLNHTSGLHNAMKNIGNENPLLFSDWNECLNRIAKSEPETEPGQEQLYHYMTYGWLCGGIIENASRKKFQEILEEALVLPLQIEGELYIGIPPGVESRLASLTLDTDDLAKLSAMGSRPELPSSFQPENIAQIAATLPALFNMLNIRRAIIPSANGHCSARALARYYAALADGGVIPPPHSSVSLFEPPLGSHTHIPKFPSYNPPSKRKTTSRIKDMVAYLKIKGKDQEEKQFAGDNCRENDRGRNTDSATYSGVDSDTDGSLSNSISRDNSRTVDIAARGKGPREIFMNPEIQDAFMGVGRYENLAFPNGKFGLGFKRLSSKGTLFGFGHSGMGGSTGFCDPKNRFAMAVTLNKMSFGGVTSAIVNLVCSELGIPIADDLNRVDAEEQSILEKPLIN